jgi:hypothetical protein
MKLKNLTMVLFVMAAISQFAFGQTKKPVPMATPNKFSDYKISQKTVLDNISFEQTIYAKSVRERRESKFTLDPNDENSAMAAQMMPNLIKITQCDLKQDITLSDKKRAFFIDYYDWSGLSPDQLKRRPVNKPIVIKGTSTISMTVTDSGKRQMMFGLQARWLKVVTTIVNSPDSCDGKVDMRTEQEGWFVTLSLNREGCQVPRPVGGKGGCRPKLILKTIQNPGFFLTGTTKIFENDKLSGTTNIETTALSKDTLDQSLFEIPKDYKEVDSEGELYPNPGEMMNMNATTEFSNGDKGKNLKTVAIDFFSGNASKVNQDELRNYISQKVSAAGMSGFLVNSQSDLLTGKFVNVIGVELKKVKESGAAKIGGLFGKVTGNDSAAKLGESEAEIVITIYGKDGKTVVATATANEKVKGKPDDAVKAAIDKIIGGLLQKIK